MAGTSTLWTLSNALQQAALQIHAEDTADPFLSLSVDVLTTAQKNLKSAVVTLKKESVLFNGQGGVKVLSEKTAEELATLLKSLKSAATNLSFSLHARTTGASVRTHTKSFVDHSSHHYDDDPWVQRCVAAFHTLNGINLG